jgi:bifunctional oligoribonuclease and PAP phosphatase NrnA
MNPILVQTIFESVQNAEHILLMTDERIDGDTMGSTMGLFHVLSSLGKRVDVFSPKPLPATFAYLPAVDVIRRDDSVLQQSSIDLIIVCDCSDGAYLPAVLAKMSHKPAMISFDHHATNPNYGTLNVIEPTAASTADVVWRFIQAARLPMSPNAAQCLLTGIVTDTQVFFSANTTNAAMEAAAELSALGADLPTIVRHNFVNKSPASLKLWGLAMERLRPDETFGGIATALTQKDIIDHGVTSEDIQGISNFLNAVLDETHDVIVVYREQEDGSIKGSARARTKNVAEIAERLYGGGGHKLAAGFTVKNNRLEIAGSSWKIVPVFSA